MYTVKIIHENEIRQSVKIHYTTIQYTVYNNTIFNNTIKKNETNN